MVDSTDDTAQRAELLQQAEAVFRATFEQSAVGMAQVGLDSGFLRVNQRLCDMLGYTREELLALSLASITHPDDLEDAIGHRFEMISGAESVLETEKRFLRKDGSLICANVNSTLVKGDDGEPLYFVCVVVDITEQKDAQTALEASELRSSTILRTSPDAILITRLSDGVYLDVNEAFCAIAGYTREDVIGRRVEDVDPWGDPVARSEFAAKMRLDGEVDGFEAVFRRKDNTLVDTLVSARAIRLDGQQCLLSVATDVSELKAAERRVRRLNRVHTMLSGINQALVHLREPQEIFEEACRVIVEDGGFRMAWLGLVDADGIHVLPVAQAGVCGDYVESLDIILGDERRGRGATGIAVSEQRHVTIQDIEHDPVMEPWREDALRQGYRSSAAFPLIVGDQAVGAFSMYSDEVDFFDQEQMTLLDELAEDISFSLVLAGREELRQQAERELAESAKWLSESQRIARLGHYIFDIQEDRWEGSPSLYDVLGVNEDYDRDFAGWLGTVHPADRERMSHYFAEEVLGRRQPFDMEYRVLRPSDGAERWVHGLGTVEWSDDDQPTAMFGVIQDITERKLAEQEHEVILQTAMDGFWLSDMEGRLLDVNEAYCEMSGYTEQELLAMSISDLEVIEAPDDIAGHARAIIAHGQDRFESRHRRKDGSVFDVESSVQYRPEGGRFAAFQRDISERKKAEKYRDLSREILQILNEPGDTRDSAQRVIAAIKTRTGFDAAGIRLRDGDDFPYLAEVGFPPDHFLTENSVIECDKCGDARRDENGDVVLECTCGLVLSGKGDPLLTPGGSFWTNDSFPLLDLPSDRDPRHHPRNVCIHEGYASMALVPIRDRDGIVGLIHINDRRKGCFTLGEIELLEGIAGSIGAALMRKRVEEQLARSLSSITEVVGRVAEQRDPYTAGHQRRVSELAVRMAAELGMSAEEIEEIRIASLIHDVGKMSVPAEILSKPGVLSPLEFELIKGHAKAGHEIILSADMRGQTAEIVYQHHERCDGSGYPRGLSAERLLPGAKVLMVADVVEAMTSHRPYRPGLGIDVALAEIESGSGGLYDSRASEVCLRVFRDGGFVFTET